MSPDLNFDWFDLFPWLGSFPLQMSFYALSPTWMSGDYNWVLEVNNQNSKSCQYFTTLERTVVPDSLHFYGLGDLILKVGSLTKDRWVDGVLTCIEVKTVDCFNDNKIKNPGWERYEIIIDGFSELNPRGLYWILCEWPCLFWII